MRQAGPRRGRRRGVGLTSTRDGTRPVACGWPQRRHCSRSPWSLRRPSTPARAPASSRRRPGSRCRSRTSLSRQTIPTHCTPSRTVSARSRARLLWRTSRRRERRGAPYVRSAAPAPRRGVRSRRRPGSRAGDGLLLYASLALEVDEAAGRPRCTSATASRTIAARRSAATERRRGHAAAALSSADPPPPDLEGLDTPALAVETDRAPFRASAYLVWVHAGADGRHQLRFAASHGRRPQLAAPLVLDQDHRRRAGRPRGAAARRRAARAAASTSPGTLPATAAS